MPRLPWGLEALWGFPSVAPERKQEMQEMEEMQETACGEEAKERPWQYTVEYDAFVGWRPCEHELSRRWSCRREEVKSEIEFVNGRAISFAAIEAMRMAPCSRRRCSCLAEEVLSTMDPSFRNVDMIDACLCFW